MAFTTEEILENFYEEVSDKMQCMGGHSFPDDDDDVYDPPTARCDTFTFISEGRGLR